MIDYLKNYLNLHIQSLNQDLEQLAIQMEKVDPNAKEYNDLDIEHTWTSGQVSACEHIMGIIEEREENELN